jgi:hypothetical protein
MPNPWVSLRRDQLIPVNKEVNVKERLEKGWRRIEKRHPGQNSPSKAALESFRGRLPLYNSFPLSRTFFLGTEQEQLLHLHGIGLHVSRVTRLGDFWPIG